MKDSVAEFARRVYAERVQHNLIDYGRPFYGDLPEVKAFRTALAHIMEAQDLKTAQTIANNALKIKFPPTISDCPFDWKWPNSLFDE